MTYLHCMLGVTLLLSLFTYFTKAQKVNLPAIGKVTYWMPGSTVALNWTYNLEAGKNLISRTWSFKSKPQDEPSILVTRFQTNAPQYKGNRTVEYIAPSMLLFQNASLADNGTYTFELGYYDGFNKKTQSVVEVIILVQPTANVSCPSNNEIKEGENFSCFCNGTTGNPPPLANWSENGVVINGNGFKTKELVFENVTKHMSGNYTCAVRSHNLTDSKVMELLVQFPPNITSFSTSNFAHVGSTIKIICVAEGYPAVNYIITHGNRTVVRDVIDGIYTIRNVTYNVSGIYGCIANNSLGIDTATFYLNVTAENPTKPTTTSSFSMTKKTTQSPTIRPSHTTERPRPTLTQSTPTLATRTPKPIVSGPAIPTWGIVLIVIVCLVVLILVVVIARKRLREKKRRRQGEEEIMNSPGENTVDGNAAKPENPYEVADEGNENGGADSDRPSTSATDKSTTPAAEPGLPPVYAVVDKSKMSAKEKKPVDPSQLTYASLDPVALQPDSSKMRPRPKEESNYASIDLDKL